MTNFLVKPDYHLLSKYYRLSTEPDIMQEKYSGGLIVELMMCTTNEQASAIRQGFETIVNKYDLFAHLNNLLYLVFNKINIIDSVLYEYDWAYSYAKRTRELAQYLLAFKESDISRRNGLILKTQTSTAKIEDANLIELIGNSLIKALKTGNVPLSVIEYNTIDRFFDQDGNDLKLSLTKLRREANTNLESPKKRYNEQLIEFCLYLYPYLTNETSIKPSENTLVSDAQLNFYFDLLCLFEFLSPDNISSEPKDYMRTLLKNKFKKDMLVSQGNKLI
ncbi:hypothetical protein IM792_06080 [Mucilaginibacter sp. JRF]|uniref:hypothetical protein n=1 Tax=Mucilaginibacter sp. JRF TaxID=2780088 RepID=UPI0018801111|nr:hypothetical protein [Mucilaginibacter sp. JRF]MBE9584011.1 hypothetical protein [Mucilaginibacter sp. JRF]